MDGSITKEKADEWRSILGGTVCSFILRGG